MNYIMRMDPVFVKAGYKVNTVYSQWRPRFSEWVTRSEPHMSLEEAHAFEAAMRDRFGEQVQEFSHELQK